MPIGQRSQLIASSRAQRVPPLGCPAIQQTNTPAKGEFDGDGIAIDDFGTGYSSLSYLKRFPIDTLKIDQSFVADLNTADGAAIVDAILALAKTLNLRVIAEGIETKEQLEILVNLDCEYGQGYFFSKPVSKDDATEILRDVTPWLSKLDQKSIRPAAQEIKLDKNLKPF